MCCGNSSSTGGATKKLNEHGCTGDRVKARYVGTGKLAAGHDYYGRRQTGDIICISQRDTKHPNFEVLEK